MIYDYGPEREVGCTTVSIVFQLYDYEVHKEVSVVSTTRGANLLPLVVEQIASDMIASGQIYLNLFSEVHGECTIMPPSDTSVSSWLMDMVVSYSIDDYVAQ